MSCLDGWTTADLIYIWKEIDPVQIVKDLNLPRFKLEQFQTTYCNTITNTGMFVAEGKEVHTFTAKSLYFTSIDNEE